MSLPIRVYLIGAGVIARHHAAATSKLPGPVELHVTDFSRAAIDDFVKQFPQVIVHGDLTSMLAAPARENDIVINATPPFSHFEPTIASFRSGRNVLCEKPLAMNVEQARAMLDAAKRHGRMLACCSSRFLGLAASARVKQMIDSGELGRVYHVSWISRRNRSRSGIEYQPQSKWFLDPKKNGGGVIMDWAPYDLAAMTELFEFVKFDVNAAWMATPETEADPTDLPLLTEQHGSASLRLHRRDGTSVPVTYERAACTHGQEMVAIEIQGTRGAVRWDWLGGGKLTHMSDRGGKLQTEVTEHPETSGLVQHDKPLVYFHRRIMGDRSVPGIYDERAVFNLSCIRAIYDVAASGQPQSISLLKVHPMPYRVYAMDTHFYTPLGVYEFDARCEMLAELEYDATYLTIWMNEPATWEDLKRLKDVKRRFGLDVAGVYVVADIAAGPGSDNHQRVRRVLETVEGCSTIELAIRTSPAADDSAASYLSELLPIADRRGLSILLYPHINFWLERIEDAVRLCRRLDHPRLGSMFCGFHWYAIDGKDLTVRLTEASPHLRQVNLCGSRRDVDGLAGKATIEPLDSGELDNFAILGLLKSIDYRGMIGFQGYNIGGDVYDVLRRSLRAFREIERRLEAHPNWAQLRPQPPQ